MSIFPTHIPIYTEQSPDKIKITLFPERSQLNYIFNGTFNMFVVVCIIKEA